MTAWYLIKLFKSLFLSRREKEVNIQEQADWARTACPEVRLLRHSVVPGTCTFDQDACVENPIARRHASPL